MGERSEAHNRRARSSERRDVSGAFAQRRRGAQARVDDPVSCMASAEQRGDNEGSTHATHTLHRPCARTTSARIIAARWLRPAQLRP